MVQAEQREAALNAAFGAAQAEAAAAKAAAAASKRTEREQGALVARQATALDLLKNENSILVRKVN